jgi:hypothetical protein
MLEVISMLLAAIAAAGSIPTISRGTTPSPSEEIRASAQETASGALTTISL